MAAHSSILAWKISGYSPWDRKESDVTERVRARAHTHTHSILSEQRDVPALSAHSLDSSTASRPDHIKPKTTGFPFPCTDVWDINSDFPSDSVPKGFFVPC